MLWKVLHTENCNCRTGATPSNATGSKYADDVGKLGSVIFNGFPGSSSDAIRSKNADAVRKPDHVTSNGFPVLLPDATHWKNTDDDRKLESHIFINQFSVLSSVAIHLKNASDGGNLVAWPFKWYHDDHLKRKHNEKIEYFPLLNRRYWQQIWTVTAYKCVL